MLHSNSYPCNMAGQEKGQKCLCCFWSMSLNILNFLNWRKVLTQKNLSCWSEVKWKSLSHVWLFVTPWAIHSPWNSPGQNTGVGSLSLLQGIFSVQGLNPGLLQCRKILYQLSHKGNRRILEWVAYPTMSCWELLTEWSQECKHIATLIVVLMDFARVIATKRCKPASMASDINSKAVRTWTEALPFPG